MSERRVKGVVDIAFLIDATGSMRPCIEGVKNNIETFVTALTVGDANTPPAVRDWRAKVVGYRDFEVDGANAFIDNPFVNTAAELHAQLAALTAEGGGDGPKSLLEALYRMAIMEETAKNCATSADALATPLRGRARHHHLHRRPFQDAPSRATGRHDGRYP